MLESNSPLYRVSEHDQELYDGMIPKDHPLRRARTLIAWEQFEPLLAEMYSQNHGRPADPPLVMLKLEYLRHQYNLSDREVIARAQTDVAIRDFLQIGLRSPLCHPTSLCRFRARLGVEGFRRIFDQLIHQAREHRIVQDRLRIKDASHVIANIAVPTTIGLVAQARDRLLAAAEPFDTECVQGERVKSELIRRESEHAPPDERLVARVQHLSDILAWVEQLAEPPDAASDRRWQRLLESRNLARKLLGDHAHPQAGDRLRSLHDPDARHGKHGVWYNGYLVDILVDPDSQMITALDVLPANADEAGNAAALVRREEQAHGNDIQAMSIDGVAFVGRVLEELEDPDGLAIDTYVPPRPLPLTDCFTAEDFHFDPETNTVTCPAGQTTQKRCRDSRDSGWRYQFARPVCLACPLLDKCMRKIPKGTGRVLCKNDHEAVYAKAREKATTDEYRAIRKEHPLVERLLGELLNRHGGRRARSRGQPRVLIQELMAATCLNIKRMVRWLLSGDLPPSAVAIAR